MGNATQGGQADSLADQSLTVNSNHTTNNSRGATGLRPPGLSSDSSEKTSKPSVPIRSSSNAKPNNLGALPMPEQTGNTSTGITKRSSKNSIQSRSRKGSNTSSKKEAVVGDAAGESSKAEGQATVTRSKRRSGFLAFLNCCSAPENANSVELNDQAGPAKKARVLQPKPGRQPTPMKKPNPSAAESSTAESKEASGDSIGGPEYSELKAAAKPTMVTHVSKDNVPNEKAPTPSSSQEKDTSEPPLPPLPPIVPTDNPRDSTLIRTEPPQIVDPAETVAVQGTTINDRTLQQEAQDSDIVMTDSPPVPPAPEEPSKAPHDPPQAQVNLPPPPPRNVQIAPGPSNAIAPIEQQKYLLPPLQPQFRGRKCLVLDLDETLVHSSFKVGLSIRIHDHS